MEIYNLLSTLDPWMLFGLGLAYLGWLAWKSYLDKRCPEDEEDQEQEKETEGLGE